MSRLLATTGSKVLDGSTTPTLAFPITISAWFYPTVDQNGTIVGFDSAGGQPWFRLATPGGGNGAEVQQFDGTNNGFSVTGTASINNWHHYAGVFTNNLSRNVYFDGVAGTTNTTLVNTPSGTPTPHIGIVGGTSLNDGRVAEVGVWNVILTAAEIAGLAAGISPLHTRPQNLVIYWPLIGVNSPEPDVVGKNNLTLTNAPTPAAHVPNIIYGMGAKTGF